MYFYFEQIEEARNAGARLRTGPELEVTGYSCEDHFYESDTFLHAWELLAALLQHPLCRDMLIDVGMPVNCALVMLTKIFPLSCVVNRITK